MSSYWAGYSGTGLVLNQDEFNSFLEKYKEKNPIQAKDLDEYMEDVPMGEIKFLKSVYAGEAIKDLQEEDGNRNKITYFTELTTDNIEGLRLWPFYRPDGRLNVPERKDGKWEEEDSRNPMHESENGACYIIWSERSFSSPKVFERPAYASYEEFMQEFKDSVETYLSDDFDWNAHLGFMSYACYA